MKFCFQLIGRICSVAVFSNVFNGDWIFPRFLFFTSEFLICGSFTSGEPPLLTYDFLTNTFLHRIVLFPFLSSHFLTCECFTFEFFTRGSFTSGEPPLFTYDFLHMILFTCVKFTCFTCECFTCGFFTCRESPLFTLHVIFLLLDFVLVDLYLGLLCVHLVFYF